jgi:GTP-binding protein EngB required for normal cell division
MSAEDIFKKAGALKELLAARGGDFHGYAERISALIERLNQGRFHLAVLGQFKRGKSTFLNALLGEAVLPASVVPLTAIPSFIRYREHRGVRIFFHDDRPPEDIPAADCSELNMILKKYVTEEGNPENRFGVARADVYHPSPVLKKELVLIDTPGIGSIYKHNTEATLNFLPQCDAALFLISADPPITDVEVEFLKVVRGKVGKLFFILNKIDYLSDTDVPEAVNFFRNAVKTKSGYEDVRVFPVSAKMGLEAGGPAGDDGWTKSGMKEIADYLTGFLAGEKAEVLQKAVAVKIKDSGAEALMRIHIMIESLRMPLDDLERRVSLLETAIREAEINKQNTRDILAGDRKRMTDTLEELSAELRLKAKSHLEQTALKKLKECGADENKIREELADAVPGFFEHALSDVYSKFDSLSSTIFSEHKNRAETLINNIRQTAAELFNIRLQSSGETESFQVTSEPYWVSHRWHNSLLPMPATLIDKMFTEKKRSRRVMNRVSRQIVDLVVYNVENLRWSTVQNLDATFRKFTLEFDMKMAEVINATRGAVTKGIELRKDKSRSVSDELEKLEGASVKLMELLKI